MMKYDQMRVGICLQEVRLDRSMTQLEVAEKIGITSSHYAKIEQGIDKMSIDVLFKLMVLFDADANTLLALGEDKNSRLKKVATKIYSLENVNRDMIFDGIEKMIESLDNTTAEEG
ncbi:MAG: helix-turn-helix transcriptional regulator [Eubacterium sp.]|nr:helix-turn-helix transcriptional regulator [Eubacterium sp.]